MSGRAKTSAAQKRRTAAPSGGPNRAILVGAGVVLVIVVAAVIAVALASAPPSVAEPADSPIVVTGEPLPEFPDSGTDPAVGMALPGLAGTGLDGAPVTIGPDGRAKAIVILAHWCPHCQAEVPLLVSWLGDNPPPRGVDVVGVSTAIDAARGNYPPSVWLSSQGWTAPTLIDDATLTAYTSLGGPNFPGYVFVTADGRVYRRATGGIEMSQFGAVLEEIAP